MTFRIVQSGSTAHEAVDASGRVLSGHVRQDQAIEAVLNAGGGTVRTVQTLRVTVPDLEPGPEPDPEPTPEPEPKPEADPEPEPVPASGIGPTGLWPDHLPGPWADPDVVIESLADLP